MPPISLNRERLIEALNRLGSRSAERQIVLEVVLYGGAAMILAYSNRDVTKDVDAILKPAESGREIAAEVATDLGLDPGWLDEGIRKFLSTDGTFAPLVIEELEQAAQRHLKISRASASYLLAMKCRACRPQLPGWPGDLADIEFLLRKMGITTLAQVDEYIGRFYPGDALDARASELVGDILKRLQAERQ